MIKVKHLATCQDILQMIPVNQQVFLEAYNDLTGGLDYCEKSNLALVGNVSRIFKEIVHMSTPLTWFDLLSKGYSLLHEGATEEDVVLDCSKEIFRINNTKVDQFGGIIEGARINNGEFSILLGVTNNGNIIMVNSRTGYTHYINSIINRRISKAAKADISDVYLEDISMIELLSMAGLPEGQVGYQFLHLDYENDQIMEYAKITGQSLIETFVGSNLAAPISTFDPKYRFTVEFVPVSDIEDEDVLETVKERVEAYGQMLTVARITQYDAKTNSVLDQFYEFQHRGTNRWQRIYNLASENAILRFPDPEANREVVLSAEAEPFALKAELRNQQDGEESLLEEVVTFAPNLAVAASDKPREIVAKAVQAKKPVARKAPAKKPATRKKSTTTRRKAPAKKPAADDPAE